jgi:hypothetical protein
MSESGQMLLLPHRSTDDRFTAISGPYLKLIDWPKGARSGHLAGGQDGGGETAWPGCTVNYLPDRVVPACYHFEY